MWKIPRLLRGPQDVLYWLSRSSPFYMVVVGGHSQGTRQVPVCHAVLLRVLLASPLQRYPRASMRSSGHRITEQLSSSFCSSFFKDPRYLFPCCRPSTKSGRPGLGLCEFPACHTHLLRLPQGWTLHLS